MILKARSTEPIPGSIPIIASCLIEVAHASVIWVAAQLSFTNLQSCPLELGTLGNISVRNMKTFPPL